MPVGVAVVSIVVVRNQVSFEHCGQLTVLGVPTLACPWDPYTEDRASAAQSAACSVSVTGSLLSTTGEPRTSRILSENSMAAVSSVAAVPVEGLLSSCLNCGKAVIAVREPRFCSAGDSFLGRVMTSALANVLLRAHPSLARRSQ
jgi:hypothetical protein